MRYSTILADPPWAQKGGPLVGGVGEGFKFDGAQRSRDLPYGTMTVAQIVALPVRELAANDAHLYLWATNRYVEQAYEVARAWGFEPSTMLVWAKALMGGGLGGAYGISTEFLLYSRRGALPAKQRERGTWFPWKRPYRNGKPQHSAKPPQAIEMIERVSPGPYLELFSRAKQPRPDWDYWGDQSLNTVGHSSPHNLLPMPDTL